MKDSNNIDLKNIKPNIQLQLKKQSWQKRRQMDKLIDNNLGKFATITVRPLKPIQLLARLHENHKIQVNAGWVQSITVLDESKQDDIEKQIKETENQ